MIDFKDATQMKELIQKVTPGPWEAWTNGFDGGVVAPTKFMICGGEPHEGYMSPEDPDTQFIALSREALPYWIERAEKAESEQVEVVNWDKALEYVATRVPIDAPTSKALASLYDFLVIHNMMREEE